MYTNKQQSIEWEKVLYLLHGIHYISLNSLERCWDGDRQIKRQTDRHTVYRGAQKCFKYSHVEARKLFYEHIFEWKNQIQNECEQKKNQENNNSIQIVLKSRRFHYRWVQTVGWMLWFLPPNGMMAWSVCVCVRTAIIQSDTHNLRWKINQ